MVYELAPSANTMSPTTVLVPAPPGASPHTTFVVLEPAKVATSVSLLGMVGGVQFSAVFQSLLVGLTLHVALPARSIGTMIIKARPTSSLLIRAFISLVDA